MRVGPALSARGPALSSCLRSRWFLTVGFLGVLIQYPGPGSLAAQQPFQRGDCNQDGALDVADPVTVLGVLFPPGVSVMPTCLEACDANDDGQLNLADAIALMTLLFVGGPGAGLPLPYPDCGLDPTPAGLTCVEASAVCGALDLPIVTIDQGSFSGLPQNGGVIRNQVQWQQVWNLHHAIQVPPPPVPAVDFSQEMVVYVVRHFAGDGYEVNIFGVQADPALVLVSYHLEACPGPLPILTQPFHFVRVPRFDGAADVLQGVAVGCP